MRRHPVASCLTSVPEISDTRGRDAWCDIRWRPCINKNKPSRHPHIRFLKSTRVPFSYIATSTIFNLTKKNESLLLLSTPASRRVPSSYGALLRSSKAKIRAIKPWKKNMLFQIQRHDNMVFGVLPRTEWFLPVWGWNNLAYRRLW